MAAPTSPSSCKIYVLRYVEIDVISTPVRFGNEGASDQTILLDICGWYFLTRVDDDHSTEHKWQILDGVVTKEMNKGYKGHRVELGSFEQDSESLTEEVRTKIKETPPTVNTLWFYEVMKLFMDGTLKDLRKLRIKSERVLSLVDQMLHAYGDGVGSEVVGSEKELYDSILEKPPFVGRGKGGSK
ncbi:hypothetical protein C8R42DRAFT_718118 [Lentinula raphanica]|nr:hypothetical protein C8R42DRAFT_718118 [Lentinula raphanica]